MEQQNLVQSHIDLADVSVAPTFYAHRFDVLVHLLALQQSAGRDLVDIDLSAGSELGEPLNPVGQAQRSESAQELFTAGHHPDWVAHSNELSLLDHEPLVADRLALVQASNEELVVGFSHGGFMLNGAVDAAVSLFLNKAATRSVSTARVVDRSIAALRDSGWSRKDLRSLLHSWAVLDPDSAVIILDAAHSRFDAGYHELECRFEAVYSEVDFISASDRHDLAIEGEGTAQTLFVRGSSKVVAETVTLLGDAVLGAFIGDFSMVPLAVLWSPTRRSGADAVHERRLRQLRLESLKGKVIERVRGRAL